MAQQTKLIMYAQERYDLPDFNTLQSLIETDEQLLNKGAISGLNCYILGGFVVTHVVPPSLNISINPIGSVLIDGANDGSLYYGPAGTALLTDTAVDGTTTYFWLETDFQGGTPAVRTFWDPASMVGVGAEFNQIVNTQRELIVTLNKNTTGFPVSGTTIPLCKTTAIAGNITTFTDCRQMLFRLGSGGNAPNLDYVYPWIAGRGEPGVSGAVGIFSGGDKQLENLKDSLDAIMSMIKEIKFGSATGAAAVWYAPAHSSLADVSIAMTGGGVWSWALGTGRVTLTADATILIPGTAFINTIDFTDPEGTGNAWISMPANGNVAYVDIDRTSNAVLTATVVASSAYVPAPDRFIMIRRISDAVYIGMA